MLINRVANRLDMVNRPVSRWANSIGIITLIVMVIFTVIDVLGRALLRFPVVGILDIQEFFLIIVIFMGIAYCQFEDRHVRITVFTSGFSKSVNSILNIGTYPLGIFLFAIVAWRTIVYGRMIGERGQVGGIMGWPSEPFVYVIGFGCTLLAIALIAEWLRNIDWLLTNNRKLWPFLILAFVTSVALLTLPSWLPWEIGNVEAGIIGLVILLLLLLLGTPIGFTMGIIGLLGMALLKGWLPAVTIMGSTYFIHLGYFLFTVIPFFILMGLILAYTDVAKDLYETAYCWVGFLPGGLGMSTVGA